MLKAYIKGLLEREKFEVTKKHILDDRKMIRSLKNDEEGLPEIVKAMFLVITETEEHGGSPNRKRKGPQDPRLKQLVTDLQQNNPIAYRQFEREVMKQYYHYRMAHHGSRENLVSKSKLPEDEDQKNSLIQSLKKAMSSMRIQSLANLDAPEADFDQLDTKNEIAPQQSVSNFKRRQLMSPTMIVNTLMSIDKEIPQ